MKLVDMKVTEFIDEIDKKSATPGGGSVSALAGALGVSLMRMTGHLTIHKKQFKTLDKTIKDNVMKSFHTLEDLKEELLVLVDKDTEAYNLVMNAFRLPKNTEDELKTRANAIKEATIQAIESPLAMMDTAVNAMNHLPLMMKYGNQNTISDLGVAAIMLYGGIQGAELNVRINLGMLKDKETREYYEKNAEQLKTKAKELHDICLHIVHNVI